MRRAMLLVVLVAMAGVVPAAAGVAHGVAAVQAAPAQLQADFNNDGADDLAVGVPGEDVGAPPFDSGAVNVLYGTAGGGLSGAGSQLFTQDSAGVPGNAEESEFFGQALASGDFNNDSFADLAVGVPGEGIGTAGAAGAVNVLYGSAGGLTGAGSQLFTQVGGAVEEGDSFGWALAAGDFDDDGFGDLAVSAPFEDVGGTSEAGAVSIVYGATGGLGTAGGQLFTQVPGSLEDFDWFGWSLASGDFNGGPADLAVGVPFEAVGALLGAGVVNVLYGTAGTGVSTAGAQAFTQVAGAAEADDWFGWALASGDFDNDTFAELAVGAPLEDVASLTDAGALSVIQGSAGGLTAAGGQLFTQVGNVVESFDQFGIALASGDFDNNDFADLAAGAHFEDVGAAIAAGAVSAIYGSGAGLSTAGGQFFTQVGGAVESGDEFGGTLASGDFDNDGFADVAAAAPFEGVSGALSAGSVSALYGSGTGGLGTAGGQLFTQNSAGVPGNAEDDDHFGEALATGDPGPAPAAAGSAPGASRTAAAGRLARVASRR